MTLLYSVWGRQSTQLFGTTFCGLLVGSDCSTKRAYRLALGANTTIWARSQEGHVRDWRAYVATRRTTRSRFSPKCPDAGATKFIVHGAALVSTIPSPWNMRNAWPVKSTASHRVPGIWDSSCVRSRILEWALSRGRQADNQSRRR